MAADSMILPAFSLFEKDKGSTENIIDTLAMQSVAMYAESWLHKSVLEGTDYTESSFWEKYEVRNAFTLYNFIKYMQTGVSIMLGHAGLEKCLSEWRQDVHSMKLFSTKWAKLSPFDVDRVFARYSEIFVDEHRRQSKMPGLAAVTEYKRNVLSREGWNYGFENMSKMTAMLKELPDVDEDGKRMKWKGTEDIVSAIASKLWELRDETAEHESVEVQKISGKIKGLIQNIGFYEMMKYMRDKDD